MGRIYVSVTVICERLIFESLQHWFRYSVLRFISLWLQHLFYVEARHLWTRVTQFICKLRLILTEEEYGLHACVLVLSKFYGTFHLDALFYMAPRMVTITTIATTMKQKIVEESLRTNNKRLSAAFTMWTEVVRLNLSVI